MILRDVGDSSIRRNGQIRIGRLFRRQGDLSVAQALSAVFIGRLEHFGAGDESADLVDWHHHLVHAGLYRYLLTMLDGLESESAGQVCVMMTAMDVGHLPPALIRSGRIELWLEMRLPDEVARLAILQQMIAPLGPPFNAIEIHQLIDATVGFTGADLKRLLDDGKNLCAFDRASKQPLRRVTDYFLTAVETVKHNKNKYAEAESRARQQRPTRPVFYDQPPVPPMD